MFAPGMIDNAILRFTALLQVPCEILPCDVNTYIFEPPEMSFGNS